MTFNRRLLLSEGQFYWLSLCKQRKQRVLSAGLINMAINSTDVAARKIRDVEERITDITKFVLSGIVTSVYALQRLSFTYFLTAEIA